MDRDAIISYINERISHYNEHLRVAVSTQAYDTAYALTVRRDELIRLLAAIGAI